MEAVDLKLVWRVYRIHRQLPRRSLLEMPCGKLDLPRRLSHLELPGSTLVNGASTASNWLRLTTDYIGRMQSLLDDSRALIIETVMANPKVPWKARPKYGGIALSSTWNSQVVDNGNVSIPVGAVALLTLRSSFQVSLWAFSSLWCSCSLLAETRQLWVAPAFLSHLLVFYSPNSLP
jgi:hypothetical protein